MMGTRRIFSETCSTDFDAPASVFLSEAIRVRHHLMSALDEAIRADSGLLEDFRELLAMPAFSPNALLYPDSRITMDALQGMCMIAGISFVETILADIADQRLENCDTSAIYHRRMNDLAKTFPTPP